MGLTLYQSNIKRNLFRRMFNSSPEMLRPVPYSQKGSHFVDLWVFPVLFSGMEEAIRPAAGWIGEADRLFAPQRGEQ